MTTSSENLALIRKKACLICSNGNSDPHHLTTRGAGGRDSLDNLVPLCRTHHVEIHKIGRVTFAKKYVSFMGWLEENDRMDILNKYGYQTGETNKRR